MSEIRLAIVGIGNCASNFIQGLTYYKRYQELSDGLMYRKVRGYDVTDIKVVAAFDIAEGKVGKDVSEAIFAAPNCTNKICDVPNMGIIVKKGPILDGWGEQFNDIVNISEEEECDIGKGLQESKADVLAILLPTGSKNACYHYIREALSLGISVVNGIPVLATHDEDIKELAEKNNACIIGDDFKSQIGGTILHHALLHLLNMRGVKVNKTHQVNYAGNTDFLNLMTKRGYEKHISKKRGIIAGEHDNLDISVNVSYVENQGDNKICFINIEGENFGGCPISLECKLSVVYSANSSGVLIEAIRCLVIAKDLGRSGRIEEASAFFMKSPYVQMPDEEAYVRLNELLGVSYESNTY